MLPRRTFTVTEPPEASSRPVGRFELLAILLPLAVFLLAVVVESLRWRVQHDAPILLYQAFLMDHFGRLPYRDFFDMNLPGTHLIFLGIGRFFGYGDLAVRAADLSYLAVLLAATWVLGARIHRRVGALAALTFGLLYLRYGPSMMLQREYLALLPIVLGVLAATSTGPRWVRSALAGVAFGLAATIKPHTAIGLVPVLFYLWNDGREQRGTRISSLVATGLGFFLPLLVTLGWILAAGLGADFWHSLGYLRYYGALTGDHRTIEGSARWLYALRKLAHLGGQGPWVLLGVLGVWSGRRNPGLEGHHRRMVALAGGLLAAFVLYPAGSGQFWKYHWLPMLYWACFCFAFLLLPLERGRARSFSRALVIAASLFVVGLSSGFRPFFQHAGMPPKEGRVDEIAEYLRSHLRPGDTVQGMDWAAVGVTHALLEARAEAATPYLYSFHFYHHVSTPYIRDLRLRYLAAFDAARPAFVVEGRRPGAGRWVWGRDTSPDFPEAEQRLRDDYRPVVEAPHYTIWERRDRARPRPDLVVILLDTVRRDRLSTYGFERETTPRLDAFRRQATLFSRAYSTSSWTVPAHASLFTGLFPIRHGSTQEQLLLLPGPATLAEVLADRGYETVAVVGNAMINRARGYDRGFETFVESWRVARAEGSLRDEVSSRWVERFLASRDRSRPLLLFVNLIGPHEPYDSCGESCGSFGRRPEEGPATTGWKDFYLGRSSPSEADLDRWRDLYDAELREADRQLGRILDATQKHLDPDTTLLAVTSDHGENLGDNENLNHVFTLNEVTTRVPLLVRYPPLFPPGGEDNRFASLVDLFPTLLRVAGVEAESFDHQGLPLDAPPRPGERAILLEYYRPDQVLSLFRARPEVDMGRLARFDRRLRALIVDGWKLVWASDGTLELYDLDRDPGEIENLIYSEEHAPQRQALIRGLRDVVRAHAGEERGPAGDAPELDEQTEAELRALGYLD